MAFQELLNKVSNVKQKLLTGARASAEASKIAAAYNPSATKELQGKTEYYPTALNLRGRYAQELNNLGVSFKETPVEALGALGTRIMTDLTNDGTRGIYWRYNDPRAMLGACIEKEIGKQANQE